MKLRAGVIGLGVGEQHIEGYQSVPGVEVALLCDLDASKRAMIRNKYPDIALVSEAKEVIENPDLQIVSIASYDNDHFGQVMGCLKNGKHVFVEKPLCLSLEEAIQIRQQIDANPDLRLGCNLILRKSPRFMDIRERVRNGELGKLYYLEGDYNYGRLEKLTKGWRGAIPFYSVTLGGTVHLVDLLLWATGLSVVEVVSMGNNVCSQGSAFRYNDFVGSLLRFDSGAIAKVTANFGCVHPHFHGLSIYGTKKTFINRVSDAQMYESRDPQRVPEKIQTAYPGVHKGALLRSFVEAIMKGTENPIPTEDIFKTLSVCFAIDKSVDSMRPVSVEYI